MPESDLPDSTAATTTAGTTTAGTGATTAAGTVATSSSTGGVGAPATTTPADAAIDDEAHAAEGVRTTARWMASAFGAIPSIAALTVVIRAPGDQGYETWKLCLGIGLAAAGGVIAVVAFAWVLAPAAIKDSDFGDDFDMSRIHGSPYTKFAELRDDLTKRADALKSEEVAALGAQRRALESQAAATTAEEDASEAEAAAKKDPTDTAKAAKAVKLRQDADAKAAAAGAAAAESAAAANRFKEWSDQYERLDQLRASAYRVRAYDRIRGRFEVALIASVFAIGLVGAGVALLALAPKPKASAAPTPPTLVTLTLNKDGQDALGCKGVTSLQALKIGGSETRPLVITLATQSCPAKVVVFATEKKKKAKPKPLGTVTKTPTLTTPTVTTPAATTPTVTTP